MTAIGLSTTHKRVSKPMSLKIASSGDCQNWQFGAPAILVPVEVVPIWHPKSYPNRCKFCWGLSKLAILVHQQLWLRPRNSHSNPHKIDDKHRESKTGADAYFVFFLGSANSHTTPQKRPPDEDLSALKSQRFLRFAIAMPIADPRISNRCDFGDKTKQSCIAI